MTTDTSNQNMENELFSAENDMLGGNRPTYDNVIWKNLKVEGDSVHGTYLGRFIKKDERFNNYNVIYKIKTTEGVTFVSFAATKRMVHEAMDKVKLGQVIGFRHEGKFKTKSGFMSNKIGVFQKADLVDSNWLSQATPVELSPENTKIDLSVINGQQQFTAPQTQAYVAPQPQAQPQVQSAGNELLNQVLQAAMETLGKNDPQTIADATGLAFSPENYAQILFKLKLGK